MIRGKGPYLFNEGGQAYLDCVNNVAHIGHSHPRVVSATKHQAMVLNTNTRYLNPVTVSYAERLCSLFPSPLDTCLLVCSGSEANDLALRIASTVTGNLKSSCWRRDTMETPVTPLMPAPINMMDWE